MFDWKKYLRERYPREHRQMMRLWGFSWKRSRLITVIAILGLSVPGVFVGFFVGKQLNNVSITNVMPSGAAPAAVPAPGRPASNQLALLRIRYGTSAQPEIIEADNVLKPISFQFVSDGAPADGVKPVAWTILVLTFDKPVTGSNIRVSFDNGAVTYERKTFTSRNASFIFESSMAEKVIQIEVRP